VRSKLNSTDVRCVWCASPLDRQTANHCSRIQSTQANTPQYGRYVRLAQNVAHGSTAAFTTGTMIRKRERALPHTGTGARAHTRTHTGPKNDVNTFSGLLPCHSDVRCARLMSKDEDRALPCCTVRHDCANKANFSNNTYTTEHWDRGFDTRSGRACVGGFLCRPR